VDWPFILEEPLLRWQRHGFPIGILCEANRGSVVDHVGGCSYARPIEPDLPLTGGENSKGEALGSKDKQILPTELCALSEENQSGAAKNVSLGPVLNGLWPRPSQGVGIPEERGGARQGVVVAALLVYDPHQEDQGG